MNVKELLEKLKGIPEDCEINIVSSNSEIDKFYTISEIVFDTVDNVFIEVDI